MLNPEEAAASLKLWGAIKLGAQILSYVGLALTAALAVFDFLYDQKGKIADSNELLPLNASGKKHLWFFAGVFLVTLVSTIFKDIADSKLSTMSTEAAKIDLRKALGENLNTFAQNALAPSIKGIASDIQGQRTALSENIRKSAEVLDKAVDKSQRSLLQSTNETAADAEMSSVKITAFLLSMTTMSAMTETKTVGAPLLLSKWQATLEPVS